MRVYSQRYVTKPKRLIYREDSRLSRRLASYAAAAGGTVALLGICDTAEAKIVYTPVNVALTATYGEQYVLRPDGTHPALTLSFGGESSTRFQAVLVKAAAKLLGAERPFSGIPQSQFQRATGLARPESSYRWGNSLLVVSRLLPDLELGERLMAGFVTSPTAILDSGLRLMEKCTTVGGV